MFKLNLDKIKQDAREHMSKGAVTEEFGADRDAVPGVLNNVLATEIVCTLRYQDNALVAKGLQANTVAAEFTEHAQDEQEHAERVAARIAQLGGEPDIHPRTSPERAHADYATSPDVSTLLRENLVAERVAVSTYREIAHWLGGHDPTSRRMMEELLEKEEEHTDELSSLLEISERCPPRAFLVHPRLAM